MSFGDRSHDGHVVSVVDVDEVLQLLAGDALHVRHVAVVDRLLREGVEQVAGPRLVGGVHCAEAHQRPVIEQHGGAHLFGTDEEPAFDVLHLRAHPFEFHCLREQLLAEVRVGDGDEGHGPFLNALAVQIGDAVLGDHVVHGSPGGHHARARLERRHDARDLAFLGGRGQGDDGAPAGGAPGALVEVRLPTDARVESGAQRVGAHLAGEIDLQRRVDGHHLVLLPDDERVVDVLRRVEGEHRVVVHVVVQLLGTHGEGSDDLAPVDGFLRPGDHALVDKDGDGVGNDLGVDAEVLLLSEQRDHGMGDTSDAYFECGSVFYQRGDVLANGLGHVPGFRRKGAGLRVVDEPGVGGLDERLIHRDQNVEVEDAHKTVTQGPRHLRVHLGDHQAGVGGGRLYDVHGDAKAAAPLRVRGGHLDQSDVYGHLAAREQSRDVGERDGGVVAVTFLDQVPDIRRNEERVHREMVGQLFVRVGSLAKGQRR